MWVAGRCRPLSRQGAFPAGRRHPSRSSSTRPFSATKLEGCPITRLHAATYGQEPHRTPPNYRGSFPAWPWLELRWQGAPRRLGGVRELLPLAEDASASGHVAVLCGECVRAWLLGEYSDDTIAIVKEFIHRKHLDRTREEGRSEQQRKANRGISASPRKTSLADRPADPKVTALELIRTAESPSAGTDLVQPGGV
jgi:hypothetical protein